jgi:hypothetical protein
MVNLSRTFPCWAAAGGEAVEILQSWTFPEYAEIAASTLEAIAARESSPRLVPEILRTWRSHRVH